MSIKVTKSFDDKCYKYEKDAEMNMVFLKSSMDYYTHLLHARGHLFLNELFDHLGLPRTKLGAINGWSSAINVKPDIEIIPPEEDDGAFTLIFDVYYILNWLEEK